MEPAGFRCWKQRTVKHVKLPECQWRCNVFPAARNSSGLTLLIFTWHINRESEDFKTFFLVEFVCVRLSCRSWPKNSNCAWKQPPKGRGISVASSCVWPAGASLYISIWFSHVFTGIVSCWKCELKVGHPFNGKHEQISQSFWGWQNLVMYG